MSTPGELRAIEPLVGLHQAMTDPEMMGKTFGAASFWTWRTLGKLVDGLRLTEPREIELYETATGCAYKYQSHGYNKLHRLILLVGRRGGKDRWLSAAACWRAALYCDWSKYVSAGEGAVVLLLGKDKKQSNILRRYCAGLLKVPLLAAEVVQHTDELIRFRNGASLEITTSAYDLVRGRSAIAVLGSEVAFWTTNETSSNSDEEIISAAEQSMGMSPGGPLLLLGSSVYRRAGYMFNQYTKLHGNENGNGLCWFATSRQMNSRLPQFIIDDAIAENPSRAQAEYNNVWRDDTESFITLDLMNQCTDFGVYERPPDDRLTYWCFFDGATGEGQDSAVLVIGHVRRIPGQVSELVIDVIREKKPKFVLAEAINEWAPILRSYRIRELWGDSYAFGICLHMWGAAGFTLNKSDNDTGDNYLSSLPLLSQRGRVRLPDSETCRRQYVSLQRHVVSGHETVTHPKAKSAHDDVAAAVSGCLVKMAGTKAPMRITHELNAEIARLQGRGPGYGYGGGGNPAQLGPNGEIGERLRGQMARGGSSGGGYRVNEYSRSTYWPPGVE